MRGLGEILKREREKKNINLEEISLKTNISERILRALENNEFHHIPGKFYFNNFLKSYLNAIDLDEDTFFKNHKDSINGVVHEKNDIPIVYYNKIRYSRFKRKRIFLGVLFLIITSIVLTYLFVDNKEWLSRFFQDQPKSNIIPETGMIMNYEDEGIRPDFYPINIEIEARLDCWIQVYRGRRKVVERILKSGEKERINGYELLVTIGNPSAVNISVNDIMVEKYKDRARPVKLHLTPQKLESFFNK
ncbi:MAG: DUF4115 domain-containing protein [Candidatus Aminicenantes bacterium]|nr:DUF4115 domain-containing protein [Candidatus Aminicenantes bacterium]